MEIKKESINLKERSIKQTSNVCAEGEIIVPDIKPDIGEVLICDANAVINSSEFKNGKLNISGTVLFNILYRPDGREEDEGLKSIKSSFDFHDSTDVSGGDALSFVVKAETEHIGFTLVNSRKLSAKVIVSLDVNGYQDRAFEPVKEAVGEGVECRKKDYNIYLPIADTQSEFTVSDFLTVPSDMPDIEEILKLSVCVNGGDYKVMNGKVMVKGTLKVRTLYSSCDEGKRVCTVTHEIPFAEIIEAENVDEACSVSVTYNVKDTSASARGDINGDTKIINGEFVIGATLKASKIVKETFLDDCYGINEDICISKEKMNVSEFITSEISEFKETQTVKMPKNVKLSDVAFVNAKPIIRDISFKDGELNVSGTLVSFLLYNEDTDEKNIRSLVTETDFMWNKALHGRENIDFKKLSCQCDVWVSDVFAEKKDSEEAEIISRLGVAVNVLKTDEIEVITECTALEKAETDKEKHALVIYFTEEGDTLWDVAKKYSTTTEKIQKANGFDTKNEVFKAGRKILIPTAC